jgi:hypothetical protein
MIFETILNFQSLCKTTFSEFTLKHFTMITRSIKKKKTAEEQEKFWFQHRK